MKKQRFIELAVKVIVAALTAFLTALGTTSCMGNGLFKKSTKVKSKIGRLISITLTSLLTIINQSLIRFVILRAAQGLREHQQQEQREHQRQEQQAAGWHQSPADCSGWWQEPHNSPSRCQR